MTDKLAAKEALILFREEIPKAKWVFFGERWGWVVKGKKSWLYYVWKS